MLLFVLTYSVYLTLSFSKSLCWDSIQELISTPRACWPFQPQRQNIRLYHTSKKYYHTELYTPKTCNLPVVSILLPQWRVAASSRRRRRVHHGSSRWSVDVASDGRRSKVLRSHCQGNVITVHGRPWSAGWRGVVSTRLAVGQRPSLTHRRLGYWRRWRRSRSARQRCSIDVVAVDTVLSFYVRSAAIC